MLSNNIAPESASKQPNCPRMRGCKEQQQKKKSATGTQGQLLASCPGMRVSVIDAQSKVRRSGLDADTARRAMSHSHCQLASAVGEHSAWYGTGRTGKYALVRYAICWFARFLHFCASYVTSDGRPGICLAPSTRIAPVCLGGFQDAKVRKRNRRHGDQPVLDMPGQLQRLNRMQILFDRRDPYSAVAPTLVQTWHGCKNCA